MNIIELSNWGTVISSIVAVIGFPITLFQLFGLKKSLKYSNLMSIIKIEFELNRRKERLANIRQHNFKQINNNEKENIKSLGGHRLEAYENYLNLFDRLSNFILTKNLYKKDFRSEYQKMLIETIDNDTDGMFTETSRYKNMLKLYSLWKGK